jgi:hypothetical protein
VIPDDVHDHPWSYSTLILKGGYYEWIPVFNTLMVEKSVKYVNGEVLGSFSYLQCLILIIVLNLSLACTAWTLFMPGPHKREWGFLVNNKWIQHEKYLNNHKENGSQQKRQVSWSEYQGLVAKICRDISVNSVEAGLYCWHYPRWIVAC